MTATPRRRVDLPAEPVVTYAIGDVHGCLGELLELEAMIDADGRHFSGPRAIVMLGDYVDRGPDSAGVLDHLSRGSPEGFYRVCLAGNHDVEFLALLEGRLEPSRWMEFAGPNCLDSYGCDLEEYRAGLRLNSKRLRVELERRVPEAHRRFLRNLLASLSTPRYFFAHAGARPGVPLGEQDEHDLLWVRQAFMDATESFGKTVVHGHTIVPHPTASSVRISVDTGAYLGNGLTAARLSADGIAFLSTQP